MVLLRVASKLSVAVVYAPTDRLLILEVLFFIFILLQVVVMLHVLVLGGVGLLGL